MVVKSLNIFGNKHIPDYYPAMYLDGYSPEEIMAAHHKSMMKEYEERKKQIETEKEINNLV